ncbi:MAG TPA: hypothetical protein VMV09_08365 [Candidatus Saccharimonadales bacterium]|nr:hypothetical protein [Candidatus Saccharimonadales bacterium]
MAVMHEVPRGDLAVADTMEQRPEVVAVRANYVDGNAGRFLSSLRPSPMAWDS